MASALLNHALYGDLRAAAVRVVFLHGFGGQMDVWDTVVADLRDQRSDDNVACLTLDLPGCGGSHDVDLDAYDFGAYSKCISDTVRSHAFEPTHIVGHSLGALMALHLLRHDGSSWGAKGVLLNPPLWSSKQEALEATWRHSLMFGQMARRPETMSRRVVPALSALFGCTRRVWQKVITDVNKRWYLENVGNFSHKGYAATMHECVLVDVRSRARSWISSRPDNKDVCVIMGRHDPLYASDERATDLACMWHWTDGDHGSDSHPGLGELLDRILARESFDDDEGEDNEGNADGEDNEGNADDEDNEDEGNDEDEGNEGEGNEDEGNDVDDSEEDEKVEDGTLSEESVDLVDTDEDDDVVLTRDVRVRFRNRSCSVDDASQH